MQTPVKKFTETDHTYTNIVYYSNYIQKYTIVHKFYLYMFDFYLYLLNF